MPGDVLYRPPAVQRHECAPPRHCAVYEFPEGAEVPRFVRWQPCPGMHESETQPGVLYGCVSGQAIEPIGSVWRCGECGKCWTVYLPENHPASRIIVAYTPTWRRSTWWERRRASK